MSYGYWGSRLPIGNLVFSKLVFAAVRWRITTRRIRNRLTGSLKPKAVRLVNDGSAKEELERWLEEGYDKLNIGGGRRNLEGFINIDFAVFPETERAVLANILDLSFIPTNLASHIHTNHVLEHLTEGQLLHQLREYHRVLKDNGLLTIRCPNALGASYGFWFEPLIEREREEFVTLGFPTDENFGNPDDKWMHKDLFAVLHWFYGDQGNIENQHLNIITPTKIRTYVETSGFQIIKMAEPEAVNIVLIATKASS